MTENLLAGLTANVVRSLIDILLIAFLFYQGLRLIKDTRAWQVTLGVVAVILFYYVTRFLDLRAVQWLLENLFPFSFIALIVIFQAEIRRALAEIGKGRFVRKFRGGQPEPLFEQIVLAASALASKRIGALIVIEGEMGLKNYIESGIKLDAHPTYDLLLTIFNPAGPLHDGAVIVSNERVAAAGCFLPLTTDPYLSKELGTRHRAAIGMTEETDAVAVVVSEETGKISAVHGGKINRSLDPPRLMRFLQRASDGGFTKIGQAAREHEASTEQQRRAV